jgi:hypothetical protein
MLAHWMVLLGRYCLAIGRWLQQWQHEQQQQLEEMQQLFTESNLSRLSSLCGRSISGLSNVLPNICSETTLDAIGVLERAQWLLGYPSLQYVRPLWETCSTELQSWDEDDVSISSGSGLDADEATSKGAEYARAWQQWQAAAGQQPVPAYGSLAGEFDGLKGRCTDLLNLCLSVAQKTRDRIEALTDAGTGASASSSSNSSSNSSRSRGRSVTCCCDDGDDESGFFWADDVDRVTSKECCAAGHAISKASSAASAMQTCLNLSVFGLLASELQAIGASMCGKLPLPWLCNNPLCSSMGGASELQLVGGSSCMCGGCRVAR